MVISQLSKSIIFLSNGGRLLIASLLFWLLLVGAPSFAAPSDTPPTYQWGRGINWPGAHFNLGGYLNLLGKQTVKTNNSEFKLDELSLFLTWSPLHRLKFFSEIDFNEWLSTNKVARIDDSLRAERLYFDFFASESTTVRIGKFLSPIGRWNVIHAAPLTWTATRPVITNDGLFSSHLNGVMITQHLQMVDDNVDILVYADHSSEFDVFDNTTTGFGTAAGGRVNFELGNAWQLGLSFINFSNEITPHWDRNNLFGLDFIWKNNGYEVMAEAIYRHADDRQGQEKGFYLQAVVPLVDKFYAVGRYEYLSGTHHFMNTEDHIGVTGLAWRPYVPLVFKAEYRFGAEHDSIAPSGFFGSIAVFF